MQNLQDSHFALPLNTHCLWRYFYCSVCVCICVFCTLRLLENGEIFICQRACTKCIFFLSNWVSADSLYLYDFMLKRGQNVNFPATWFGCQFTVASSDALLMTTSVASQCRRCSCYFPYECRESRAPPLSLPLDCLWINGTTSVKRKDRER